MENAIRHQPMTLAAIDIETAPDPEALDRLAGRAGGTTRGVAVHMVTAAAWIVMVEDDDGGWTVEEIESIGPPDEEFDVLLELDRVLARVGRADGEVSTYNGVRHDMPVIRRRAIRHWMFELPGLFPAEPIRHRDVMRVAGLGIGDWPKLREACAGLGFTCDADDDRVGEGHRLHPRRRKAETDAVATLLLRLHELAADRRDVATLTLAWSALAEFILARRPRHPHLLQFTESVELHAVWDPPRPAAG